jgi:hypothetical protein
MSASLPDLQRMQRFVEFGLVILAENQKKHLQMLCGWK